MGSSHSAPRRSTSFRRSRRRSSGNAVDADINSPSTDSRSFAEEGSSQTLTPSTQWPAQEELPSLLEEAPVATEEASQQALENSHSQEQEESESTAADEASTPIDTLSGLPVIQSTRVLRADEMEVDSGENSSPSRMVRYEADDGAFSGVNPSSPDRPNNGGTWGNTYDFNPSQTDSSMGDDSEMDSLTPSAGPVPDFFPQGSRNSEWMGRSIETLTLGYASVVPILCLPEDEEIQSEDLSFSNPTRRRSTVSTLGSFEYGRRSSLGSLPGNRRGSLRGNGQMHGGTLANYYNRRRQNIEERGNTRRGSVGRRGSMASRRGSATSIGTISRRGSLAGMNRRGSASHGPTYRRRMSISRHSDNESRSAGQGGPNIALSLLARETTGRRSTKGPMTASKHLRAMGGHTLFSALDRPAGGMCSEVAFLSEVIDSGDWAETQTVISRIAPRLIGDPSAAAQGLTGDRGAAIDDPNLPPTASSFYAGGGRLGLERDAFVQAGGIDVMLRIFKEPSFVGAPMARSYDARDLSEELVSIRLAPCWNEALASLRELVFAMPSLVETGVIFDDGEFVPFLFTLLSHDSCFDGAAALIEEILSLQSHSMPQAQQESDSMMDSQPGYRAKVRVAPATTFFLGNVPRLYKLWGGFNCRQLAHFCRILALLVFEPEDRQLLESPAVLKSIELLQLRRNRAVRAGRDSTVDMNQAIMLGDEKLIGRLLKLLRVMNFAPVLRRNTPYHVMTHFPFIPDTLVMLGLGELDTWSEIDRLEKLARKMVSQSVSVDDETNTPQLNELGTVADMLETLSRTLLENQSEAATNQLSHIIHVISAAQQAGVVVGSSRRRRQSQRENGQANRDSGNSRSSNGDTIDGLASAASILTDRVLSRRLYSEDGSDIDDAASSDMSLGERDAIGGLTSGSQRQMIVIPEDAANALQFNALLLSPYQVEVLFVLCTILGGRRKIDAQDILNEAGVIPVLDDMFQRLPWDSLTISRQSISQRTTESDLNGSVEDQQTPEIHGPGCECTPESALCVQYLRLLHNFCDRDCDNYAGRRLLLSDAERAYIFEKHTGRELDISTLEPGLLSKIVAAFMGESDESPYRFWLASCIESYLRGSSPIEQIFVAKTGLLNHLINDIASERLHCAGSLQTSFDLLGELCKGNTEVLHFLVRDFEEESFRKFMSVAAANLVDSNVFIRSLLLTLERLSSADKLMPLHLDAEYYLIQKKRKWRSHNGVFSRGYVTHSWWETHLRQQHEVEEDDDISLATKFEARIDAKRPSDWFPAIGTIRAYRMNPPGTVEISASGLHNGVGHFGWIFTPEGDALCSAAHEPNSIERLSWFLAANQTRLLRDLLNVVDLRNINHENICCLNTAVVIAIFAHRRNELHNLLQDLRRINHEERETKRRALKAARNDDVVDRAFVQAMKYMDIERETVPAPYSRRASLTTSRRSSLTTSRRSSTGRRASLTYYGSKGEIGDKNDVMRNFREVLWFWIEYYTHRGRDRLSLEFSSHLRFQEWIEVVSLLGADDGSPTSLVRSPVHLPHSPYQRSSRLPAVGLRGL